ncbi:hypothetical protein MMC26_001500 [Xylographa opegraphella]|nr:hypothetical protein [Xylographa opegraphella]
MDFSPLITVIVPCLGHNRFSESVKVFHIGSATLSQYLPLLQLAPRIDAEHLVPQVKWSTCMQQAFLWLFTHIHEVSLHGISGALLQSLETSYKRDRQRERDPSRPRMHGIIPIGRAVHLRDNTSSVFDRLAYILRNYGYHADIFDNMATFFTRHCDRMARREPRATMMYLRALRAAAGGGGLNKVLACLSCQPRTAAAMVQFADEAEAQHKSIIMPNDVRDALMQLVDQKALRTERERGRLIGGRGRWDGAIRRPPRTILRGDELGLEDLEDIWLEEPHRIAVDVTGREDMFAREAYDDDGLEDEDAYYYDSSESEDPFFEARARRRAYAQPRQRRRIEGVRHRGLAWQPEEMRLGGYGERVGAGGYQFSEL